jgi:hypothetical protein
MRSALHAYPSQKARHGELILRRHWQRTIFLAALAVPILWLLAALLFPVAGH